MSMIIAGVDIGNSTTEVCVGEIGNDGRLSFLTSASCSTTGTKGTLPNVHGVKTALKKAMSRINKETNEISLIRLKDNTYNIQPAILRIDQSRHFLIGVDI